MSDLRPATYRLTIQKEGFRTVVQPSLQLYAQDAINENFTLAIGLRSETITLAATLPDYKPIRRRSVPWWTSNS